MLVFMITISIYRLVINRTNTGVFRLKLPGGAWKIFNKNFASICFFGVALDRTIYQNIKNLSFWSV